MSWNFHLTQPWINYKKQTKKQKKKRGFPGQDGIKKVLK